jgi:hypothetical protein
MALEHDNPSALACQMESVRETNDAGPHHRYVIRRTHGQYRID